MKITNIGGATAILEHAGKRMLFDPWMNEGIFHGSWFHWPPLKMKVSEIGKFDFIYISHIHEDHCSLETLRALNRDAEVILMDREPAVPNFVARFLKNHRLQFKKVHLIRPQSPQEIAPGMVVDMLTADPEHEYNYLVDSGLILKWDGHVIYNANDCAPYADGLAYLQKNYGTVDLALLPYAGGSGYPNCYRNLSDAEKIAERDRILNSRMKGFVETVRKLNPQKVMPFADQFVIGGSRSHLNRFTSHPVSPEAVRAPLEAAGLGEKLVLLNSGQAFDLDGAKKIPAEPYQNFTEQDREKYVSTIAQHSYDHEKVAMRDSVPLERLLTQARARLWSVQERQGKFPATKVIFQVENLGRTFQIDLTRAGIQELPATEPVAEPFLKISLTSTLLTMMLINHISWNIADGALFLDYERRPNVYDPTVYAFLNHLIV